MEKKNRFWVYCLSISLVIAIGIAFTFGFKNKQLTEQYEKLKEECTKSDNIIDTTNLHNKVDSLSERVSNYLSQIEAYTSKISQLRLDSIRHKALQSDSINFENTIKEYQKKFSDYQDSVKKYKDLTSSILVESNALATAYKTKAREDSLNLVKLDNELLIKRNKNRNDSIKISKLSDSLTFERTNLNVNRLEYLAYPNNQYEGSKDEYVSVHAVKNITKIVFYIDFNRKVLKSDQIYIKIQDIGTKKLDEHMYIQKDAKIFFDIKKNTIKKKKYIVSVYHSNPQRKISDHKIGGIALDFRK